MKKHRQFLNLVSALLILVTLEITSPQGAATFAPGPPPLVQHTGNQPQGAVFIVVVIICIVLGVIIWGIIKMANRIPPPPPPDDGEPTNITIASYVTDVRYMQFTFDLPSLTNAYRQTNSYLLGGSTVLDERGNAYQLLCSYNLYSSSNATGPWILDGKVTNWIGGNLVWGQTNCSIILLTNEEVALYNAGGQLAAARRFPIATTNLSDCLQPPIVMPPMHFDKQFYRLVLLEQ